MKYIVLIFVPAIVFFLFNAYKADKSLKEKDSHIKELEREVFELKFNKHTDSVIQYHTIRFKKKLDSMFAARFTPPSP